MYYFAKYLVHPVATTSQPVFPIDVKDPVDAKIRSDHKFSKEKKEGFQTALSWIDGYPFLMV
jgi:hypothetical protein